MNNRAAISLDLTLILENVHGAAVTAKGMVRDPLLSNIGLETISILVI